MLNREFWERIYRKDVREATERTIQKNKQDGGEDIAITVIGFNGQPITMDCMDNVIGNAPLQSYQKAYTALMTGTDTIELAKQGINPQNLGEGMNNLPGGIVLKGIFSRRIVAAIGVAGKITQRPKGNTTMRHHKLAVFCGEQLANIIMNKRRGTVNTER